MWRSARRPWPVMSIVYDRSVEARRLLRMHLTLEDCGPNATSSERDCRH